MTRFSICTAAFAMICAAASAGCSPRFNLSEDAANGDVPAVQRDLANKIGPNTKLTGEPVLLFAAGNGHLDVIKALLRAGADVNAADDQTGYTALMAAAGGGHADLIKPLVVAGANIEVRDSTGDTALTLASIRNKPDVVQALIDAGANVNDGYVTPSGPTILSIVGDQPQYADVAQVLIRNGGHT